MWADENLSYAQSITGDDIYTPVLVIPLRPEAVEALRAKVRQAINWWWDGESDYHTCLERSTDDVLKTLGIKPLSPKYRKWK
jgi:hypothetical protein